MQVVSSLKLRELEWFFGDFQVSIALNECDIYFSAIDLARALEYKNPEEAVSANIDDHQKFSFERLYDSWGDYYFTIPPDTIMVTLSTAIQFIFNSSLPQSHLLLSWLCDKFVSALLRNIAHCPSDQENVENAKFVYVFTSKLYLAKNIYQIGCCRDVEDQLLKFNESRVDDLLYKYTSHRIINAYEIQISLQCAFGSKWIRSNFYCLDKSNLDTIDSICCIVELTVDKIRERSRRPLADP